MLHIHRSSLNEKHGFGIIRENKIFLHPYHESIQIQFSETPHGNYFAFGIDTIWFGQLLNCFSNFCVLYLESKFSEMYFCIKMPRKLILKERKGQEMGLFVHFCK